MSEEDNLESKFFYNFDKKYRWDKLTERGEVKKINLLDR